MKSTRHDFSNATRVRNTATGTVYERIPGTDRWTCARWPGTAGTTQQLEALPEMDAEDPREAVR